MELKIENTWQHLCVPDIALGSGEEEFLGVAIIDC